MTLQKTNSSSGSSLALALGAELVIFALVMALFLVNVGWFLAVEVAVALGLIFLLKFKPAISRRLRAAFREARVGAIIGIVVMLIAVPFLLKASPYWLFILITAGLYIMAAMGLNLQLGSTGMMNLASAAFMAFGAYTAGLLALNFGWPTGLTLVAGALVTGLFSILLFIPVLKTKGHYLALVTIAFQFMVVILVENMEWTGGPQGLKNIPLFNFFGYSFNTDIKLGGLTLHHYTNYYFFMLVLVALVALVCYRLYHSWVGVTLSTIRDDEVAAKTNGVKVNYWKLIIFVLGNCFIGLSGAFYSHMVGFISPPNFQFDKSLVIVSIVILGGMDNIYGIILGSILLIVLPEKLRVIQDYRFMIYGLVLVIMLIFQPKGLIPFQSRDYLPLLKKKLGLKSETPEKEAAGKPA
jgi:branched-chain amino acid transport system permease protein